MLRKNAVEIVKNMQRLRDDRDRAEAYEEGENRLARRKTIQNLVNQQQKRQPIGTLDVAFRKRFQQLSSQTTEGKELRCGSHSRHVHVPTGEAIFCPRIEMQRLSPVLQSIFRIR